MAKSWPFQAKDMICLSHQEFLTMIVPQGVFMPIYSNGIYIIGPHTNQVMMTFLLLPTSQLNLSMIVTSVHVLEIVSKQLKWV